MSEIEHDEEETVATPPKKRKGNNIVISILIIAAIIAGVIYFNKSPNDSSSNNGVVAVVNNEEIKQSQIDERFDQIKSSLQAQGANTEDETVIEQAKKEILEEIITTTILKQKAKEVGISVNNEDIDAELQKIKDQIGDVATFEAELEKAGLTEKILKENIKNQLTIQKYLDQEVDVSSIVITDEEIAKVYDEAGATQTDLPPLETVSEQIKAQIEATKKQELVTAFIEALKESAEIVRN